MTHKIKIRESFADAVNRGDKTFEVRKNDRGYQKGDVVQFVVLYDSDGLEMINHPLNEKEYEITYVLSGWGIEDGYCVFGIKPMKEQEAVEPYQHDAVWLCGNCEKEVVGWHDDIDGKEYRYPFCRQCGKGVKWNESPDVAGRERD